MNDGNFWTSENRVRLFANGFYSSYFVGYNSTWGVDFAPLRGYYFADDYTSGMKQAGFEATFWDAPRKESGTLLYGCKFIDRVGPKYSGTNAAQIIGYYIPENFSNRDTFTDRVYLAPVGNTQINQYKEKGYNLTQTTGW